VYLSMGFCVFGFFACAPVSVAIMHLFCWSLFFRYTFESCVRPTVMFFESDFSLAFRVYLFFFFTVFVVQMPVSFRPFLPSRFDRG